MGRVIHSDGVYLGPLPIIVDGCPHHWMTLIFLTLYFKPEIYPKGEKS
jgi:hypothetical protein